MEPILITLGILGIVLLVVVVFLVSSYNRLVGFRNKVKDQFAQIDVQLKRRFDLIPNLVETVKGYAAHESETFKAVIEARNNFNSAKDINSEIAASNELTGALTKLFALSEAYPELKANTNFMQMQNDLRDTEDKIAYARQFYNDTVLSYNNVVEMFPTNIVAGMFGFKQFDFFKTTETEKDAPKVEF